jgi:hypothetical protein
MVSDFRLVLNVISTVFLSTNNCIVLNFAVNNSLGIQLLPSIPSC